MAEKKKIMIVEDDSALGMMYKAKLESVGYEIILADNGSDAIKIAQEDSADLILLDVIIPQLDGFSVLTELKKNPKTKGIPVIMSTNLGTDEDRKKGESLGAVDYLVKSNFTPEELSKIIEKYLK